MHHLESSFITKRALNQGFVLFSLTMLFCATPVLAQGLVGQPVDPRFCGGMHDGGIADNSVNAVGASVNSRNGEPDQIVILLAGIAVLIVNGFVRLAKSNRTIPIANPNKSDDLAHERVVTVPESKRLAKLACPVSLLRRTMSTNSSKQNPCSASGHKQLYRIRRTASNE